MLSSRQQQRIVVGHVPDEEHRAARSGRGPHRLWVAAAGSVRMVAGAILWVAQPSGIPLAAPTVDPGLEVVVPLARGQQQPRAVPATRIAKVSWRSGVPTRVVIGRLGVAAPVVPIKAPDGILTPPSDPLQLGWWSEGAKPGALFGSALIAGHTVHSGGGALDNLERLEAGAMVTVETRRGAIRYRVASTDVYRKGALARDAQRLFSQTMVGRLVLLTCEDWDGTRYLSNVVVVADPISGTPS